MDLAPLAVRKEQSGLLILPVREDKEDLVHFAVRKEQSGLMILLVQTKWT